MLGPEVTTQLHPLQTAPGNKVQRVISALGIPVNPDISWPSPLTLDGTIFAIALNSREK